MAVGWVFWGALCCALSVAGGAFGAHGLAGRLDAHSLLLWEAAARYLMYGGIGQVLAGLAAGGSLRRPDAGAFRGVRRPAAAGGSLLAGSVLFSGTLAALALGAPRWLGMVTPLGGLPLIAGFLLLAWPGISGAARG